MEAEIRTALTIPPGLLSSCYHTESNVIVSLCPTGRVIAFLSQTKAHFIATEDYPDTDDKVDFHYQNSFQGTLDIARDPNQSKPLATACVVVPVLMVGLSHSSSIIIVGFSDGSIGAFSKTGKRIFMQQLHTDSVSKITVMVQPPFADSKSIECSDLAVLMKGGIVCIVNGVTLAQLIEENISKKSQGDPFDVTETITPLMYKKFNLEHQSNTLDIALIGHYEPSPFDYLREACLIEGHDAVIRYGPISEARLISVGEQPMISLYKVTKDAGTINVSEVVHEVASRMTNAVLGKLSQASGWFGWSSRKNAAASAPPPEEKQQRTLNLKMSTNIPDIRRQIQSIVVSPVGNIAVMVDGFGRIILLDTLHLIIRRMWKGYRGAQCSWLRVYDTQRIAQCLCIYLPRGVLEFWPVENGERVAVFSMEKNCRLLHSYRSIFGKEEIIKKAQSFTPFADKALLLCPDGKLLTFEIPFPSLIKRNNPLSHDYHLLQRLREIINSVGNINSTFIEILSLLKSSQALLEAVQLAVGCFEDKSFHNMLMVLDTAIHKSYSSSTCTVPEELIHHFINLKNLAKFYHSMCSMETNEDVPNQKLQCGIESFTQLLVDLCGLHITSSQKLGQLIALYSQIYTPTKTNRRKFTLADFIACFDIEDCDICCILPDSLESKTVNIERKLVKHTIKLKSTLPESPIIDLAAFIVLPLLLLSYNEDFSCDALFIDCPVSLELIIYLVIKFVLSGTLSMEDPSMFLVSVHKLLEFLVKKLPKNTSIYEDVANTLSNSHLPGHSLVLGLICKRLMQNGEDDEWEDITLEKQQWEHLCEQLELLTSLSLVTGIENLRTVPSILHLVCDDDEEWSNDLSTIKFCMSFEDKERKVCVVSLEEFGPALLGHCIARSLVRRKMPGKVLTDIRIENEFAIQRDEESQETSLTFLKRLQILVNALPNSLSKANLLLYCAFDAALQWSIAKNKDSDILSLAIDYIRELSSPFVSRGLCSFLWHTLLEREVFVLFEAIRKEKVTRNCHITKLIWACRSIMHFLEQLSLQSAIRRIDHKVVDNIQLKSPQGLHFLPNIVEVFPQLDNTVISVIMQLLLQTEIILECSVSVNLFTYYSSSIYSGWKKGLFNFKGNIDVVSKAITQKRIKFLNEAVTVLLNSNQQLKFLPCTIFESLEDLPRQNCYCQIGSYSDTVFSLAKLWNIDLLEIQCYWVANLVGAGYINKGIEVFHCIGDKECGSVILLPIIGQLCLHLLKMFNTTHHLHIVSQIPPAISEWMRKQKSSIALLECKPVSKHLLTFIEVLKPHTNQLNIINELTKLLNLLPSD